MKTKITLGILMAFLSIFQGYSQIQFWSDNFEDAGAPSSGTRTPSVNFSCGGTPATSYFYRSDLAGVSLISGSYSGFDGSKFWAGEDIDYGPTCTNASISANQQVTWTVNIAGKSGLSFKGFFAANGSFATNWEGSSFTTSQDYVMVEYRIDGGAWNKAIVFYASSTAQSQTLKLETTGDLIGDGADLTYAFSEFAANIAGTGTTLDLRLNVFANGSGTEEIAIDNFRLFETPACTAPTITGNPPNRSICVNGNTTFSSTATGATAYQWQVNTGSGFTDITNGGVYSNATTNTLTITGATAGMNGYLYRCTAINGVASCFTNSNSGTLNISNITSSTAQNNVACFGTSTGSAAVSPTGGIGSYTYSWSPSGGTSSIATGLSAGSYTVTITDAISCQITKNFTITQPASALNTSAGSQSNVSCNAGANGTATVSPSGGTPGYTYSWSPSGGTAATASSLSAGAYTVTVTDANNCTATKSFTITQPPAISGSTVVTNVACNGGTNGAINLTPSGGTPGYTFSWVSGPTTEDRTGLAAGSYSVTITDANACTKTVTGITVTQPTAISGSTVVTNVACNGGTSGAINLTPSGGTPGYTFSWVSGPTTEDRTGLAAGSYSVTITDANACTGVVNATVTQPTAVSGSTVVTNVACNGGTTGAINLTPSGGTPGYTFSWASGPTTEDRTGLAAGSYSVTITDANACTGVVNATVTQPTAISVTPSSQTNVSCFGGSNGAASINTPTGGAGGYTYNWTPGNPTGDGTVSVTGLSAGTWTCTVTDANACTASQSFTVTQPTAISVTPASQTNVSCNGGSNGAASINTPTGGAGGYTYNWTPGTPTGDGTVSVTGLSAGTWTCTVTDANACTASQSFTVTQPTAISVTPASQTNVACNGGSNGAASINTPTGGAGGYTYNWTPGNPTGDGTVSITGLSAGTWTCTVTDANACTASQSFTVTQPTAISVTPASQTNVSCFGGSNGAAAINTPTGGAGGYTYNWTPGNPTGDGTISVTGLSAGTWTCTVTDANACTASQSFTVTQPTAISLTAASQTNVSCFGGSNGAASVNTPTGGAGGYTYNWTPGNPTGDGTVSVTGLSAGTWTCTVTDANACTASQSFTVTQPTAISLTAASQTNVACNGGSNGAASVNIPTGGAGGYTYNWTPGNPTGDGTVSVTGLTAGTWTCTVTDANSCTKSQSFTITQPTAISVTPSSQTNVACNGGSNGVASINTPTGGAGGYTYNWTPGNPSGDGTTVITGLTAGTWTCTVTDANGCVASQNFTVTQPTPISVTAASQTNVSCNGGSNGSASINTPTGGAGGFTYNWTPGNPIGDGTTAVTGLSAGTWTCTVTDANGCVASQNFTVTQPTPMSVTAASQTNVACNGGSNGAAAINTPTGGAGGYTYNWTPGNPSGDGTVSVTGLTAGTWTCTVTDANGCIASQNFTVTQPTPISVTAASQTNVTCNGGSNGAAAINAPTGGTPGYTYDWTPGTPTGDGTISVTGLTAGTWTCNVTDANGCTASQSFTITQAAAITNTLTATSCNSYTVNGQTYTTSGTYTQVLTSVSGCDSTLTLNLTINNSTTETLNATSCSTYTLNGTTYNTSGTYTQTLTNAAGCDSTITLNLIINQPTSATLTESACTNYTLNGTTYNTSGTYTQTLTNAAGCDSVITLNLTINQATSSNLIESACDSYTLNGQTYTTSGTYVQTMMNSNGCDSVITLTLTINHPSSSSSSEFSCGSYTWAQTGMTYTASGMYMDTIPNASGCDSVITLNLTIGGSSSTENVTACGNYTWNQTGVTYTASGMYSDTLTDGNGCDSILILNLTITGAPSATITNNGNILTASSGTTYQWLNCNGTVAITGANGQTFAPTSNGSYSVVVTNAAGCSDTAACVVVTGLGLEELDSQSVQVFPNPTENQVTITMTFDQARLVITDVQGKTYYTGQISNGQLINLAQYADGVYFLSIETETGKILKRIVKN